MPNKSFSQYLSWLLLGIWVISFLYLPLYYFLIMGALVYNIPSSKGKFIVLIGLSFGATLLLGNIYPFEGDRESYLNGIKHTHYLLHSIQSVKTYTGAADYIFSFYAGFSAILGFDHKFTMFLWYFLSIFILLFYTSRFLLESFPYFLFLFFGTFLFDSIYALALRQAMATSFISSSMYFFSQKKISGTFGATGMALMSHLSAVPIATGYLLRKILMKYLKYIILACLLFIILSTFLLSEELLLFASKLSPQIPVIGEKLRGYIKHANTTPSFSLLYLVGFFLPLSWCIRKKGTLTQTEEIAAPLYIMVQVAMTATAFIPEVQVRFASTRFLLDCMVLASLASFLRQQLSDLAPPSILKAAMLSIFLIGPFAVYSKIGTYRFTVHEVNLQHATAPKLLNRSN